MAYGKIKADALIYDNSGSDVEKTIASLAADPEGTAIKSTGENTADKYLRTDGDGTSSWQPLVTALTETDKTISSSLAITTGKNAMSVGDVTLASGVVLTIPANSKYILIS